MAKKSNGLVTFGLLAVAGYFIYKKIMAPKPQNTGVVPPELSKMAPVIMENLPVSGSFVSRDRERIRFATEIVEPVPLPVNSQPSEPSLGEVNAFNDMNLLVGDYYSLQGQGLDTSSVLNKIRVALGQYEGLRRNSIDSNFQGLYDHLNSLV